MGKYDLRVTIYEFGCLIFSFKVQMMSGSNSSSFSASFSVKEADIDVRNPPQQ